MVKENIQKLADEYIGTEKKLLKGLEELPRFMEDCNCDDRNIIRVVHEGNFPEIVTYCLSCGGVIGE